MSATAYRGVAYDAFEASARGGIPVPDVERVQGFEETLNGGCGGGGSGAGPCVATPDASFVLPQAYVRPSMGELVAGGGRVGVWQ